MPLHVIVPERKLAGGTAFAFRVATLNAWETQCINISIHEYKLASSLNTLGIYHTDRYLDRMVWLHRNSRLVKKIIFRCNSSGLHSINSVSVIEGNGIVYRREALWSRNLKKKPLECGLERYLSSHRSVSVNEKMLGQWFILEWSWIYTYYLTRVSKGF